MPTPDRPKVIFFDVNETLLDLAPLKKRITEVLEGNEQLVPLWFTTLLQYSLVTSSSERYTSFAHIGAATLQMVAANNDITISQETARNTVTRGLRSLPAHPEVKDALARLKAAGYTLVTLTNGSQEEVDAQCAYAGLTSYFTERLSVEEVGKFKPFAETYSWAARRMGAAPEDCMLVAAHGWDVAGARWSGWRAAFVDRPGQQVYPLGPDVEIVASDLRGVAEVLTQES
ncbi:(S)-2-haloacid dehalogenase [Neolewinella maritima]|uniref:(S)-2-haloacid dehalogenase n=1 Tax=Neolewinella maritima TaxID=1383882 RepID=A0ABN8F1B3_9BACT|nr:haloacid dehalogenase type II [Neolewinella maritima]CAH0998820.1 (S)-2-haloacid dehalogenase [Neolewinella maritima]